MEIERTELPIDSRTIKGALIPQLLRSVQNTRNVNKIEQSYIEGD